MSGRFGSNSSNINNEVFYSFGFVQGVNINSKWGQKKNPSIEHSTQTISLSFEDFGTQSSTSCISNEHSVEQGIALDQEVGLNI